MNIYNSDRRKWTGLRRYSLVCIQFTLISFSHSICRWSMSFDNQNTFKSYCCLYYPWSGIGEQSRSLLIIDRYSLTPSNKKCFSRILNSWWGRPYYYIRYLNMLFYFCGNFLFLKFCWFVLILGWHQTCLRMTYKHVRPSPFNPPIIERKLQSTEYEICYFYLQSTEYEICNVQPIDANHLSTWAWPFKKLEYFKLVGRY